MQFKKFVLTRSLSISETETRRESTLQNTCRPILLKSWVIIIYYVFFRQQESDFCRYRLVCQFPGLAIRTNYSIKRLDGRQPTTTAAAMTMMTMKTMRMITINKKEMTRVLLIIISIMKIRVIMMIEIITMIFSLTITYLNILCLCEQFCFG